MRVLFVLALCLAAGAALQGVPQRIVGGTTTTINQHPSMVSLLYSRPMNNFRQSCGGSIINNRAILTAAHCLIGDTAGMWRARVGSTFANSGGVVHAASRLIMHPQYNSRSFDNDIAIIHISSRISFNNAVQSGRFAGANYNLADNQPVWAVGWGAIRFEGPASEQLRHVQVWTVNQNICRNNYAPRGFRITANMLCAGDLNNGGRDACQGDSGGPLYHNGNVVGVCSFGWECALARYPGVNARVSRYIGWIENNA